MSILLTFSHLKIFGRFKYNGIFTFINYPNYLWKLTNNRGIMSTFALGFK